MKIQRDNIKKYQQRIEQTLEKDRNLAKRLLAEGKKEWVEIFLPSFNLRLFFYIMYSLQTRKITAEEETIPRTIAGENRWSIRKLGETYPRSRICSNRNEGNLL